LLQSGRQSFSSFIIAAVAFPGIDRKQVNLHSATNLRRSRSPLIGERLGVNYSFVKAEFVSEIFVKDKGMTIRAVHQG
jgi:hypothetical protein